MWGRCVNDAVRKFLQFRISTNITAVVITFVSAVASTEEESVLTAVQLLWINIIMDTFAALALATDPASEALLDRKPDTRGARLFTADMIKMIIGGIRSTRLPSFSSSTSLASQRISISRLSPSSVHQYASRFCASTRFDAYDYLLEIARQVLIVFINGATFQVTCISGYE